MAYYSNVLKSPIVLSDTATLKRIHTFEGMTDDVTEVHFSPDGMFLAAADGQAKFNIWYLKDFSVVSSRVFEKRITSFEWGPVEAGKKTPDYYLVSTNNSQVEVHRLTYDIATMVYVARFSQLQLPNTGLNRFYECSLVEPTTNYYYSGTRGGELCVFDVPNKMFKASVQVGKSSLRSLFLHSAKGLVYCGFSNGQLKELAGRLDKWVIQREAQLDGSLR